MPEALLPLSAPAPDDLPPPPSPRSEGLGLGTWVPSLFPRALLLSAPKGSSAIVASAGSPGSVRGSTQSVRRTVSVEEPTQNFKSSFY